MLLMIGGRPFRFLLILGLILLYITPVHGMSRDETCNITNNRSILDIDWAYQQTSSHVGIVLNWPLMCAIIYNNPPQRPNMFLGNASGIPGANYCYYASAVDPDGDQIKYTFDWGDGTTSIIGPADSGTKISANHSWSKSATYQIRANATDSKGATSGWSESWTVFINAPPNNPSMPSGSESIYAWAPNSYSTSIIDPDEDPVKCTFDWGDGNKTTTDFVKSGSNTSTLHIWEKEGTYQIKVIARDLSGSSSEWSDYLNITVIANNRPKVPINLFGPSCGYAGIAYYYFTLANDLDNDMIKYTFDWGDGTVSKTDLVNSGSVENASHIWSKAGTYQVKCNTTDSKGSSSMWSKSLNVTIADNNPPDTPIIPSGPTSGFSGTAYNYVTSANDPDDNHVRYVIDWGDGTTSWTGLDFIDSGINESLFHKWSNSGMYLVKAMAMDDKGAISSWSNALTVNISAIRFFQRLTSGYYVLSFVR
ncbi:MAG: PKD domain-containing protein [Methanothrix sp.]|nr:PKD domain-containing protein [Methanothrix sp.]